MEKTQKYDYISSLSVNWSFHASSFYLFLRKLEKKSHSWELWTGSTLIGGSRSLENNKNSPWSKTSGSPTARHKTIQPEVWCFSTRFPIILPIIHSVCIVTMEWQAPQKSGKWRSYRLLSRYLQMRDVSVKWCWKSHYKDISRWLNTWLPQTSLIKIPNFPW